MSRINLIKVEDRIIDFTPKSVPTEFFPIDSAVLIIGENGSGKTNLLRNIATNKSTKYFWGDSAPHDHHPYILYFNPVEHQKLSRNTTHFQDISTIKSANQPIWHDEIFNGALNNVAFEVYAEPAKVTRKIVKIIREYIESNDGFQRYVSSGMGEHDIRKSFFKEINEDLQDLNTEYAERHFNSLHNEFLDNAWEQMQTLDFIILFHVLNSQINNTSARNDILDCFGSFLSRRNYPFNWERTEIYDTWMTKKHSTNEILGKSNSAQFIGHNRIKISEYIDHPMFNQIFSPCKSEGSSGEKAIRRQFTNIHHAISRLKSSKNVLLLIDEGDALLHVTWQAEYINSLMSFLASLKNKYSDVVESIQAIITTHSPVVASDFPKELITSLDDTIRSKVNTFATPIDVLISSSLGDKAIGDFAASKINEACNAFKHGSSDPLEYILSITDNPIIKAGIQDMLSNSTVKPKDQE